MAESKITVARVKDKVGGREAEVSKLLYSDNGNIKTIGLSLLVVLRHSMVRLKNSY